MNGEPLAGDRSFGEGSGRMLGFVEKKFLLSLKNDLDRFFMLTPETAI